MMTRDQKKRRFTPNEMIWYAAAAAAVVSALFSLVVSVLLVANYFQIHAITPLDNPELIKLRQQLAAAPQPDEQLVAQIRALDLLTRKAFFTSQAHLKMGARLLVAAVIVLLVALRVYTRFRPKPPTPQGQPPAAAHWTRQSRARTYVAVAGVIWIAAALLAAFFTRLDIPVPATAPSEKSTPAYPDWDAMQQNWPSFRGPGGIGVAHFTTAPTEWDGASGKNIKWKTEVPLPGTNSPVVWGKRVFLSGATDTEREVFCFDVDSGKLLWRHPLEKFPGTPEKPPKVGEETSNAAPTMVAHGDRVFALFANGDIACLDFDGNPKWGKNLGPPDDHYGHASSLIAYQNLLYVQYDQRSNSKLIALDVADGHEAWNTPRQKISWASPVCVKTQFGFELVLASEKDVDAYDPATGTRVWTFKCLDGEVAPSPAYGGGMFFVANDNAIATAIKFDPNEKTPKPTKAWEWDEFLPDVASPVGTDTHFYIATSRGQLACLDIASGKTAWSQEFDEGFHASPILVGDRIYAFDQTGVAHIFKTGAVYEVIATPKLVENVEATPAFMDGCMYIRTEKNLICVARSNEPAA